MSSDSPKRILIIGDDPAILERISLFLEDEDCLLTFAENAGEGLRLLEEAKFELIMMDHSMPGATGDELVAAIKSSEDAPVILITSHAETHVDVTRYEA